MTSLKEMRVRVFIFTFLSFDGSVLSEEVEMLEGSERKEMNGG